MHRTCQTYIVLFIVILWLVLPVPVHGDNSFVFHVRRDAQIWTTMVDRLKIMSWICFLPQLEVEEMSVISGEGHRELVHDHCRTVIEADRDDAQMKSIYM